ncbi:MAG: DUF1853 family protein [Cellvibrio sp.]|uniref:DUF1853 family protein n=1 Tax=Cellvibrio sp. TaxID=1965322 RepID=UPI00319F361A
MPNSIYEAFKTRIHELEHQAVRDLAWCCFSPPIIDKLPDIEATILHFAHDDLWGWLEELDQHPDELLAQIAQTKSTRLGIYYETLWRFFFSHRPDWKLLHHNLQVERNGITLGAFDFLCRHLNEYWHIETAVKFYLCISENAQDALKWESWIGPASHDRLDLKLKHLSQHQLPLHQSPEAKTQLQQAHPENTNWKTGLCMQGYLFSPAPESFHPKHSNKNHGSGYWWFLSDFLHYINNHAETKWIILDRQRWLSPAHSSDSDELIQGDNLVGQLQKQIGENKRPLLLAAMEERKLINSERIIWQEFLRCFVVPDNWPEN